MSESETPEEGASNFVRELVLADVSAGKHAGRVGTRFPPEPNGYLHIGHAKSIALNFGLAERFGGTCNLRFDDTNPSTEDVEYVESIQADIRWLGYDWQDRLFYASDYFEQLYVWAEELIGAGKAYVDSRTLEEIRETRGNFYKAGTDSPFRERSVEENLALFRKMRAGELAEGSAVLRAKIDMASPNQNLRDPPMYRIKKAKHHRTGDRWCIYPMYDYAHGQSDAIERITHSVCTLEFENHRPLYEWYLGALGIQDPPRQIEFARLSVSYMVLSKRKLQKLVSEKHVAGWDDPRMPTLAGLRRRGYTPEAIRAFCDRIGVARKDGMVDVSLLEHHLREDLNARCPRFLGVLRPIRLVLENYPQDRVDICELPAHPEFPDRGSRRIPFCRELYIDADDFREDPPPKWFRLAPGREVRLRGAALVTCTDVVKDAAGNVVELRATWDERSAGGNAADGRKVKGTIHWVSARHAVDAEVRLYDRLFSVEDPTQDEEAGVEFTQHLHPDSLEVLAGAKLEPALGEANAPSRFQLERLGYFCFDTQSSPKKLVVNRTISLKDTWAKMEARGAV